MGGKIPGVVYGAGKDSLPVTLDPRQVTRILHSETGHNTIFDLAVEGGERTKAMIVDWQYEPIKGHLLHIDLKRIAMDQKLTVSVPIVLKGEAAGVKQQGGILEQILREVEIECLPGDIPSAHRSRRQRTGIRQSAARFRPAARRQDQVHHRREPARGPRHHGEGRSGAGSEAVAADAAATPAEPEVIKKGKQEAEAKKARSCREAGEGREERKEVAGDVGVCRS